MNEPELTPIDDDDYKNKKIKSKDNIKYDIKNSRIFENTECNSEYIEVLNNDNKEIKIIFRTQEALEINNSPTHTINSEKLDSFQEVTIIFDFQILSIELSTEELKKLIEKFQTNISSQETKLSLIIRNTFIDPDKEIFPLDMPLELILNKLEIWDELYGLSTNLNLDKIFTKVKANELVLKKFKFNSKAQLSTFCQFIQRVECKKLTLEDINIELIIKKDEKDEEYKDLDIYFSYLEEIITLDNVYTNIISLTLIDCPMFAIIGNMFKYKDPKYIPTVFKDIDVDENSLINPFIITKFKIHNGKYDICFDLDSLKLKLEEMEENNENINDKKINKSAEKEKDQLDYIDYLDYIFSIIISFSRENENLLKQRKIWKNQDIEDGVGEIQRKNFYRLTFKNFDTTKYEYITGEDMTFIDEDKRIFNEEEKEKKAKWEKLELDLENFKYEKLENVKELVFDNCSNFFIKWILKFTKGEKTIIKSYNNDLDLLKIKKCGKDYVDLKEILKMQIGKLILFDTPLIIGDKFPEKGKHLDIIKDNFGSILNLTIKINSLDCYGKEFNLNTIKTLEILLELIESKNFNKNITFELSGLSEIMTFLALKAYIKNQEFYNNPNEEELGVVKIDDKEILGKLTQTEIIKIEDSLPKQIFFSSLKKRDALYYKAFKLEGLYGSSKITLKTSTIKKRIENFDNQNFFIEKNRRKKNEEVQSYTNSNKLKKIDFGSDGFFIDRDYKFFFSQNHFDTIELNNVSFSSFKDNSFKDLAPEIDTIILNLIRNTKEEENRIICNNYQTTYFPNYRIDYITLNRFLYRNYSFQDVGDMFKYYIYKVVEPNNPNDEKKFAIYDYFEKIKEIFNSFRENITQLTIILNNIKDLKELYCTICILNHLENKNSIFEEQVVMPDKKNKDIKLPKKSILEKELGIFFLKDKNEEDRDCYSEMNYFYLSSEEINMIKNKEITIKKNDKYKKDYIINLEIGFDYYSEI